MKPVTFEHVNITFAKDQPEYLDLPALVDTDRGTVITCWDFTWKERIAILFQGCVWLSQMTFNKALQPQRPSVERPFDFEGEEKTKKQKFIKWLLQEKVPTGKP